VGMGWNMSEDGAVDVPVPDGAMVVGENAFASHTVKIDTGHGSLFLVMGVSVTGGLHIEKLFAYHDHADPCFKAMSEALCRSIAIGLRSGVPVDKYIRDLRGISCGHPAPYPPRTGGGAGGFVESIPDAIAMALQDIESRYAQAQADVEQAQAYVEDVGRV
jgi:hypothetical protein